MRILYSHRVQSRDGQGVHIESLVHALRAAGHDVLVVGPRFYEQAEFGGESRLVAWVRRLLPGVLQEIAELAYNVPAYIRLARAYASVQPDFIYERCNLFFLAGTSRFGRFGRFGTRGIVGAGRCMGWSAPTAPDAQPPTRHGARAV
jgi:hypothetical protein